MSQEENTLTTRSEQTADGQEVGHNGPTVTFFAIGVVLNIVMITAYFIWAYRQWKKSDN